MAVHIRTPTIVITYGSGPTAITNVLTAHTAFGTDIGIGEASFVVPELGDLNGATYGDEVDITLSAGVTTPLPWRGKLTGIAPSYYPRGLAVTCKGFLIGADRTEMDAPADGTSTTTPTGGQLMAPADLSGETDTAMSTAVLAACGIVPTSTVHYSPDSCLALFGTKGYTPFIWSNGESGLSFCQRLDEASVILVMGIWYAFRTFDAPDGTVKRTHIDMVPASIPAWTFTEGVDILDAPGQYDSLLSKDKIVVTGFDAGDGAGAANYTVATGSTALHISNPMIEFQTEADGGAGTSCEGVANATIRQWNFVQQRFTISTPRDDDVQVTDTIEIDFASNSRFGTPALSARYWTQNVQRDIAPDGAFTQILTVCSGGG